MAITLTNLTCEELSVGGVANRKIEVSLGKVQAQDLVDCLSPVELAELVRAIGEETCCQVLEITPAEVE